MIEIYPSLYRALSDSRHLSGNNLLFHRSRLMFDPRSLRPIKWVRFFGFTLFIGDSGHAENDFWFRLVFFAFAFVICIYS